MATISKPHTFSGGTLISSTQVNADFDTLYGVLSGTSTTTQLSLVSSDGNTPVTINQQSANYSQEWQDTGITKLRVLKSGVLESLVTTGTAPIVLSSSTVVTNLNADLLDGLHASSFAQISAGVLSIAGSGPIIKFVDSDNVDFWLVNGPSGLNQFSIRNGDTATDLLIMDDVGGATFAGNVASAAATPSDPSHLTRKDYVDGKKVPISIGAFFPGAASTSAARPSFIVPDGVVGCTVTLLRATYQSGTNTGTTTIQWVRNGVAKDTLSLNSEAIDTTVTVDIPDLALNPVDRLYFKITNAGNHGDITIQLIGEMLVA